MYLVRLLSNNLVWPSYHDDDEILNTKIVRLIQVAENNVLRQLHPIFIICVINEQQDFPISDQKFVANQESCS